MLLIVLTIKYLDDETSTYNIFVTEAHTHSHEVSDIIGMLRTGKKGFELSKSIGPNSIPLRLLKFLSLTIAAPYLRL